MSEAGRVLVVRHVPFEHLGSLGEILTGAGIEYEYADTAAGPGAWDALILMGGPMSANDDLPCISLDCRLIESALARGKPILGICLGAQVIAKCLGAPVFKNPVKEIGWAPVYWTDDARSDRLFRDLSSPQVVFHWHGETFDLPSGARWLAWSDACANQAFRFGTNVYGLQFHLEVTPEMIRDWLGQDANSADVRELPARVDPEYGAADLAGLSKIVFGRWYEMVRLAAATAVL